MIAAATTTSIHHGNGEEDVDVPPFAVKVTDFVAVSPTVSLTVTVTVNVPETLGVHCREAVFALEHPAGRLE
jgi:cation transporter-like permease